MMPQTPRRRSRRGRSSLASSSGATCRGTASGRTWPCVLARKPTEDSSGCSKDVALQSPEASVQSPEASESGRGLLRLGAGGHREKRRIFRKAFVNFHESAREIHLS